MRACRSRRRNRPPRLRLLAALLAAAAALAVCASPAAAKRPPELNATAWVLVDARTGAVLTGDDARLRLPIASTTKLMTAYLTLRDRSLPLAKMVPAADYAANPIESLLGLSAGQLVSVHDLLYGLILRSGNDAAVTLAEAVSGSEDRFVASMNRTASALGLSNTHYANPIGLDEAGNYSSAEDLAVLGRRLLAIPAFARIAAARSALLRSFDPDRRVVTRNTMLFRAPWATGVKTGHTIGSGYVLVGAGEQNGVELISAVLGAPSETERDLESLELLSWGFSLYRQRRPVREGQPLASPEIRFAGGELPLRAARTVAVGVRRNQRLEVAVRAPDEVEGPIARGRRLGTAVVTVDGRRAAEVPLRAARSIPKASTFDRARSHAVGLIFVVLGGACVILVVLTLIRRRRRRTGAGP